MRRDFANLCNNPGEICSTARLEIKEFTYDDKVILYIYVYESSDVHKTANKIYDRNEDGDFEITNNTSLVHGLWWINGIDHKSTIKNLDLTVALW